MINPLCITGSMDGTIMFWRMDGDRIGMMNDLPGHRNKRHVNAVVIGDRGESLFIAYNRRIRRVQLPFLQFSEEIVTDKTIDNITQLDYSDVSRRLVSGSWDYSVRLFETDSGGSLYQSMKVTLTEMVMCVRIHPNQHTIFATDHNGIAYYIDTRNQQKIPIRCNFLVEGEKIYELAVSPNGKYLIGGTNIGRTVVWHANDFGSPILINDKKLRVHPEFSGLLREHFAPSRTPEPYTAEYWESRLHSSVINKIRFKDDDTFAVASADGTVSLWSLHPNRNRQLVQHLDDWHRHCLWAYDTSFITYENNEYALVASDKVIRQWNIKTGRIHRYFTGHASIITAMAFRDYSAA